MSLRVVQNMPHLMLVRDDEPPVPSPSACWRIIRDLYGQEWADRLFPQGEPPRDAA